MINATVINLPDEDKFATDTILCPHCGSQMLRNKMDNPYTIHGRSYICESCGAEEIISPEIDEDDI